MALKIRRVVTGHDQNGRAVVAIDELCRQGVAETDQDKRKAIYAKIQETLLDDLPFAPIFVFAQIVGYDNAVKNYRPNPYVPINAWNCNEWSIG